MKSITRRADLIDRWASPAFITFSLLLILVFTLSPFADEETFAGLERHWLFLGWGRSSGLDVVVNILLFSPFGFTLASYLVQQRQMAAQTALVAIFLVSFGLSYAIEILQIFMPSRFPSFIDVLANSTGGMLGFSCARLWVKKDVQLSLLAYVTTAFLISMPLQWETRLSNWDTTFPLLLGNEWTGDRPWRGYISDVYIGDRAMSEVEVARAFSANSVGENFLLASYQLSGTGSYPDQTGSLPDLVWRRRLQYIAQDQGVFLGPHHWLETVKPAFHLAQRIMETSQFTLSVTVATGDTMQTGPARIVSLSKDTVYRNFTLGQEGSDLVFRLRTPLTGKNGASPELIVPEVFATTDPQNLVVTYDGATLLLYVNGVRRFPTLELTPGGAAFGYFFDQSVASMKFYKILYYALIFIPLGILLSLYSRLRRRLAVQILIIGGGVLFPPLILESMLVSVSGRGVGLENLLLGIIFTASTVAVLRGLRCPMVMRSSGISLQAMSEDRR